MKKKLGNAIVTVLSGMLFLGGAAGLLAQEKKADQDAEALMALKKLVYKKFDGNRDGVLTGQEKSKATAFLQNLDKNGDDEISSAERTLATAALNKMPDPAVSPAPVRQPQKTTRVMKPPAQNKLKPIDASNVRIIKGITAEELDKKSTAAAVIQEMRDKQRLRSVNQLEIPPPSPKGKKKKGFYDRSTILAIAGDNVHCPVPRGAVLNIPPDLAGMVVKKPVGKMMIWPEFLKKYSKLLIAKEVSIETARGQDPIKETERKAFATGGKVVVAVYHKNPITVLEAPPEKEDVPVKGAVGSDTKKK